MKITQSLSAPHSVQLSQVKYFSKTYDQFGYDWNEAGVILFLHVKGIPLLSAVPDKMYGLSQAGFIWESICGDGFIYWTVESSMSM